MTTNPPKLRKYQMIWLNLKQKNEVAIAAPALYHKRIIKAVIKEKYRDTGYKLQLAEKNIHKKIEYTIEGNKITFRLVNTKVNISDL